MTIIHFEIVTNDTEQLLAKNPALVDRATAPVHPVQLKDVLC
jgi:hypothetical protein